MTDSITSDSITSHPIAPHSLSQQRTVIDQLDLELLNLINRRAQAVAEIARLKRQHNLPVSDEAREAAVLNAVVQHNVEHNPQHNPQHNAQGHASLLNAAGLRRIFGAILAESRRLQYQLSAESSCTK